MSIIVPVYKVEPYLRYCIDSILSQTFTDFELILVDDGSPDDCGAICDEYAEKDARVVVIHQKNQGLSAARNNGIDWAIAKSDSTWFTFVDSDDVIAPTYLDCLCQYAEKTKADMVATSGYWFSSDEELNAVPQHAELVKCISGKEGCISHYSGEAVVSVYAWGKLIRKEVLSHMRFPVGKQFEDEGLMPQVMYNCGHIAIVSAYLYCYRQRQDSIVHVPFSLRRFDHLYCMDLCIHYFGQKNEIEIVRLAKKRREKFIAKYVLLSYGAGLADEIPPEYRIPVGKAAYISFTDTISHGGIKYILVRIKQFLKRIQRG